jgi:phosphoesterase RecJ-like protein
VETAADGRIVFAVLTPADFAAAGAEPEDTENVVDMLKGLADGEVQILLKATDHNHWRASLRSSTIDVAVVAQQFGGGGHAPAAGCTISGSLPEVRARIIKVTTEALAKKA